MTVLMTNSAKMNKNLESNEIAKAKLGRTTIILAVTIALLTMCILLLVSFGGWYLNGVNDRDSQKEKFELSITLDDEVYPEHTYVDVDEQSELVIIRDPETLFVFMIMFVDFKYERLVVYRSKEDLCLIAALNEDFISFTEELGLIRQQNGTTVDTPPKLYHEIQDIIMDPTLIPPEMKSFCTLENTYWAVEVEQEEAGRVKRSELGVRSYCGCCRCCCCCGGGARAPVRQ